MPNRWIAVLACAFAAASHAQNRPVLTYQYDEGGNLTSTRDALGRVTDMNYDSLDRLRSVKQPKPSPSETRPLTRLSYDGLNQLTGLTDPRGLVTTYTLSGLGDTTRLVSPDTGTTRNTFDAAGNLLTSRDARGKTTTYTYDSLNRLTRADYADNTFMVLYYDQGLNGVGRLTRMEDPGPITTAWTYTAQGRVSTKSQTVAAGGVDRTHTIQYGYNGLTGQLTSITYPSGAVVALQYGASSRDLQSVTLDGQPLATGIAYYSTDALKSMQLSNGVVWSSTIDQDGRITSYTLAGVPYAIQWDAANRIRSIMHATSAYWSRGYAYDGLDRIASFVSEPRNQTFNYDLNGNLLSKSDQVDTNSPAGYVYTIDPASNRMTAIGSLGINYTIDAAGNRTSDGKTTWVVDARGRVKQVRVIDGAVTDTYNYLINGQGLRVRKRGPSDVVPQGTQVFVYDEAGRLLGEYDNLGRARNEHVWIADRPIALISYAYAGNLPTPSSRAVYAVEADHLGTPRMLTDSTGASRWHWHSAPYGDTQPDENPSNKGVLTYNLRFAGQYFDKETNLHYNWNRDYEATTGTYIQSDPIGLAGGINTYAYVNGNPLMYYDPYGLFGWADMPTLPPGLVDFSAGFGDSMSFNITGYVRAWLDIGGVNECSGFYRGGELADLAFETGTMGLSAGLKALAANASSAAARSGARPFVNAFREANNLEGGFVHHPNPLFGNPGAMGSTMFPTGGLPAWINSGAWNLQWVADRTAHTAAHARTKALEDAWRAFVNPASTGIRAARDVADACTCQ